MSTALKLTDRASEVQGSEFRQGWRIVLAAMVGIACGASSIPFVAFGQLLGPIHEDLGWSLGSISFGMTLRGLLAAFTGPAFGWLADRYGARRVALASLVAFAVTFGALGFIPGNLWAWWIGWAIAGFVVMGSSPLTWTHGINLWFFRQRGLALGIALTGTSFAGMAVPFLAGYSVDHFGWRATFPLLALFPLIGGLPVAWWLFREPRPEQRPPQLTRNGALIGVTVQQALGNYRFWLICCFTILIASAYSGIFMHLQQMLELTGFAKGTARGVVSSMALAILIGRLGTGWLLDRIWAPVATLPILGLQAVACLLLSGDGLGLPLAYACAVFVGLAAGAVPDLLAYLTGRYFGMANYGRIYGLILLPFAIAGAISPFAYGWVRDSTGDYSLALTVAVWMSVLGAALLFGLGRHPDFASEPDDRAGSRVPAYRATVRPG